MSIDPAVRAQSLLDTPSDEWGRDGDRLTWVLDARHALRGLLIALDAEGGRADLLADTLRLRTAALNRVATEKEALDAALSRVRGLLAEAERQSAMSLSRDFNGNRWEEPIMQADLRAALADPSEADA